MCSIEAARLPSRVDSALLNNIGLAQLAAERLRARGGRFTSPAVRDGVPDGVLCNVTLRCDSKNVCARVCSRGSVTIDPWLRFAVDYQWRLSRRQPLCFAQLLGTHNSAITLADGYGMHDDIYSTYLRYLRLTTSDQSLITNNQVLSLTDQMEMGVRFVELDVHWIQSDLHIAHCGGFHSPRLNELVGLLSSVARVFGHPPVEWDAETLGCSPSLSSLPTRDQRLFADALSEVAAWLLAHAHADEFLALYLDNQMDLQEWGKVGLLLEQVTQAIPASLIITPPELRDIVHKQGSLPSVDQLVNQYGKRVLLMSGSDYGEAMSWLAFNHYSPCDFTEPLFRGFHSQPNCSFHNWRYNRDVPVMAGRMIRTPTCHLTYGPYNCSLQRGGNDAQLDAEQLPGATSCGINVPAPDMMTPQLVQSYIWSWAPGHPPELSGAGPSEAAAAAAAVAASKATHTGPEPGRQGPGAVVAAEEGGCAMMRSSDGRWVVQPCSLAAYAACRLDAGSQHLGGPDTWTLAGRSPSPSRVAIAGDGFADCPGGYVRGSPHTARENAALWRLLLETRDREGPGSGAGQQGALAGQVAEVSEGAASQRGGPGGGQRQLQAVREPGGKVFGAQGLGEGEGEGGKGIAGHWGDSGEVGGAATGGGTEGDEVEGAEVFVLLALAGPSWLPAA